jgi:NAD(P)-dependent dehydrogenase (short-subunit alcohol dehydrogenase family)
MNISKPGNRLSSPVCPTGIGWATAKLLLDCGLRVFGSVRKRADVDRLSATFGPKGRIVMISSASGKFGFPMLSAYTAAKHAIEGLSESLRREMMLFGIHVIVAPGIVKTPIWRKPDGVDIAAFRNSPHFPALEKFCEFILELTKAGLPPERIAEGIAEALMSPSHKGALRDRAGSDAATADVSPAQASGRQDIRQASGVSPSGG